MMMAWLTLFFAGALEIAWAVGLKVHNGNSIIIGATVIFSLASAYLLSMAMKEIPMGTAYAVWTGIGIVGTFAVGALFLGDAVSPPKLIFTALILVGLVGLKLTT